MSQRHERQASFHPFSSHNPPLNLLHNPLWAVALVFRSLCQILHHCPSSFRLDQSSSSGRSRVLTKLQNFETSALNALRVFLQTNTRKRNITRRAIQRRLSCTGIEEERRCRMKEKRWKRKGRRGAFCSRTKRAPGLTGEAAQTRKRQRTVTSSTRSNWLTFL